MPDPVDPTQISPWIRLRRFFQLEGKLGGLRYSARIGVLELVDLSARARVTEIAPPAGGREVGEVPAAATGTTVVAEADESPAG